MLKLMNRPHNKCIAEIMKGFKIQLNTIINCRHKPLGSLFNVLVPGIGQESAYMRKLDELPPGTSQRSSSFCKTQRKYKVIRY
jgi:hypothetical protein